MSSYKCEMKYGHEIICWLAMLGLKYCANTQNMQDEMATVTGELHVD